MVASTTPASTNHPYVELRPDVQGGRAVVKGTRFPVSSIVQNYRRGLSVDEILAQFPQLTPAQVFDALSYYHDHQSEIDRDLAELSDQAGAMQQFPPTLRPSDVRG